MKTRRKLNKVLVASLAAGMMSMSCNKKPQSSATGWNYNDSENGGYLKTSYVEQETGPGLVLIEGGTFTMGSTEQDVTFDWDNTPKRVTVSSFYMDETEITNQFWGDYMHWTERTYIDFPLILEKATPDQNVWRSKLGYNEPMVEYYLKHPAYQNYPVVGVSWLQAVQYCKWRTSAVNLKNLIDKGVLSNVLGNDTIRNFFDTDLYLENPYKLFDGDSTVYKRGMPDNKIRKKGEPKPPKGAFTGRQVTSQDGILSQKFRLPTEVEWEFAAKATIGNREYNNIRGRKKYAWNGKYTRDNSKRYKGDQLANFKQRKGSLNF